MTKRTGRVPGMGIRAYLALGLTVMVLLFTASFFYFMSMAREVSVSGTRTYGLFVATAENTRGADSRNLERLRGAQSALRAATAEHSGADTVAALSELSSAIAELENQQPVTAEMLRSDRDRALLFVTIDRIMALQRSQLHFV